MILVDTSIWIDHFRRANPRLIEALASHLVLQHPFVTVELALGSIPRRSQTITDLGLLPQAWIIEPKELLEFVDGNRLFGSGIGSIDANLLASTARSPTVRLWTLDKRLAAQAQRLGLAFQPN